MAGFSLLALLDDISTVLDDVAVMTKVAAKKTAGVLGDDLALNAQQVAGVRAERELPVVWAVAKGSLVNKAILIPVALLISALAPYLITPLLMLGGSYLCFEGAEKLAHKFLHKDGNHKRPETRPQSGQCSAEAAVVNEPFRPGSGFNGQPAFSGAVEPQPGPEAEKSAPPPRPAEAPGGFPASMDPAAYEKKKIRGAVRTDFILSAEIIVIALGTVPEGSSLLVRAGVLSLIGVLMTVGVYGLVGGIVKLDDLGFWLMAKSGGRGPRQKLGAMLVGAAPFLMRFLSVAGTAAMFLVGGGILAHGLPFLHYVFEILAGWPAAWLWPVLLNALVGLAAGFILLGLISLFKRRPA